MTTPHILLVQSNEIAQRFFSSVNKLEHGMFTAYFSPKPETFQGIVGIASAKHVGDVLLQDQTELDRLADDGE